LSSPSTSKSQSLDSPILRSLNPQQQQAVLATEGPALIIAGAGTGKTRVIAHRIAFLLEKNPALAPSNILALAFSRKAAREMQERVQGLLGPGAAGMEILTFHGFCHRFLQDHARELGLPSDFKLLDRAESWIFLRKLLPELKLNHFWNFGDPTACIHGFLRFISRAKDELVGPERYAEYVAALSDPQERARAEEVARVYRIYQKRIRQAGYLDFGDLIVETYNALKKKPALLAQLQAAYRYFLVDEFQDTNVAQIGLLGLLAGASGNLCVVGDDDQAIYRFRGASFASFLLMKSLFPKVQTVGLTQNYRTTPGILAVVNRLIRNNEPDRYDPDKHLQTENALGEPVQVFVCHDSLHEAQKVVETIRALVERQPPAEWRFDRIAVLYRAHAHREDLINALRAARIPFVASGGAALFDQLEIKELLAFVRVLQDPHDSVHLFRVASHPVWGIPLKELVTLTHLAKDQKISLWEACSRSTEIPVGRLLQEFLSMKKKVGRVGIAALIASVAEETSLQALFHAPSGEGEGPGRVLGRFLRFASRYAANHPKAQGLEEFLWTVDSYILSGEDPADEEEEKEAAGDAVRLMSIHQAKGLEFDWVILLGMVQGRFPTRGRTEPIPFPVDLMKEPLPQGDYHLQEERRLCYVGCTRAKQGLFLMTRDRAYHRSSIFVKEMLVGASPEEIRRLECPVESVSTETGKQSHPRDFLSRIQIPAFAGMTSSRFSFTQLQSFRYCPLKYRFAYLYRIPVKASPEMNFGTDIHACLEGFSRQVMGGYTPSLQDLLDTFYRCHTPGRYGEPYQDEEYRRLGIDLITVFYTQPKGAFTAPLFVEKPFLLEMGSAGAIRGVVDRVDPLPGGGVEIIDYKTGKPKEEAKEEDLLQLRLYALAAKEVFQLEPKRVSFYFLRNNQKLSFDQKEGTLEQTRQKLTELMAEIQSSDFAPTPAQAKCRRCEFRNLCPASMV